MSTQRYSVTPHQVETLLAWVKSGEIAIPEIQRPFVWDAIKVRNLLDSLYQGYPIGYLIAWRNPTIRLKDGTTSAGKRILIDGQQRVTALMAALLGQEVLTKDYETIRIRIAFHPQNETFEVTNPAIQKDPAWIPNVADLFASSAKLLQITKRYCGSNKGIDEDAVFGTLERLRKIVNNNVGVIELADDLDIETVTDIFIRVNSAGATLSQADFVMSKIAADEKHGGNVLRKAIDYFCHLAVAPEFLGRIKNGDSAFVSSEFFASMRWLANVNEDIYDPSYTDMLRVAFTSQFRRGKLQDLVALLSGRNFETKQFEETIVEDSFARLKSGVLEFMNETHFHRFTMIIRSAGFEASDLIRAQNSLNFAYILYLRGRADKVPAAELERLVRRWYVMAVLRGRYTGSAESTFDYDIRQIEAQGLANYVEAVISAELPESYWTALLPQEMDTSVVFSPYFLVYQAAQLKLGDRGFLSRDITVRDLVLNHCDVHHVFPKNYLKKQHGLSKSKYNQIGNFVIAQSEINIAIGDRPPDVYFGELAKQCDGGKKKYGGITSEADMRANLRMNALPDSLLDGKVPSFEEFLDGRRRLMAQKVKTYFELL